MQAHKRQINLTPQKYPEKPQLKNQGKSPIKPSPSSTSIQKRLATIRQFLLSDANFAEKALDKHLRIYPEEVKHKRNHSPLENPAVHNKALSADNQNLSIKKIIQGYINSKLKSSNLMGYLEARDESETQLHPEKSVPDKVMNSDTKSSQDLKQNVDTDSKIDQEFIESIEKYFFNKFQEKNTKEEKKNTFNQESVDFLLQLNENHERKIQDFENMLKDIMNEICESDKKNQNLEEDFEKIKAENHKLTEKNRDLFHENSNLKKKSEACLRKNSSLKTEVKNLKKDLENKFQLRMNEICESDKKYQSLEKNFEKIKAESNKLTEKNRYFFRRTQILKKKLKNVLEIILL